MKTESGSLLVVEDHPVTGDLLARWLQDHGHTVALCQDGNRAIEMVAAGHFDLVLLDVGMPGADGFAVLRALRVSHPAITLPVIMATAYGQSEMIVRALELGANDYVTKPYDLPVLLARVHAQLSAKRLVEQKAQLERALAERNKELEIANQHMKEDLEAAARIQEALLPPAGMEIPGLRLAWAFRPCEHIGGDTFNVFALDDDHIGLYLLDVSGHGVPAALLSVHLSLILSPPRDPSSFLVRADGPAAGSPASPADIVESLNRRFAWKSTDRYFTMFYGVLNTRSGELRFACAPRTCPPSSAAGFCRPPARRSG
jgi:sigma-B regulation protein RsbU (phosphoserine phosphatase)